MKQRLLEFAARRIAQRVAANRITPNGGDAVIGTGSNGGQSVALLPRPVPDEDDEMIEKATRYVSDVLIERKGNRVYVNCPPVHGVVPTINGINIFDSPRPYLALPAGGSYAVVLAFTYSRTGVVIPDNAAVNEIIPGLAVTNPSAVVSYYETGSVPSNVNATDPGGDAVEPWAGDYEVYWTLGTVIDGVVTPATPPLGTEYHGGFHLSTTGGFNAGVPTWEFDAGFVAP